MGLGVPCPPPPGLTSPPACSGTERSGRLRIPGAPAMAEARLGGRGGRPLVGGGGTRRGAGAGDRRSDARKCFSHGRWKPSRPARALAQARAAWPRVLPRSGVCAGTAAPCQRQGSPCPVRVGRAFAPSPVSRLFSKGAASADPGALPPRVGDPTQALTQEQRCQITRCSGRSLAVSRRRAVPIAGTAPALPAEFPNPCPSQAAPQPSTPDLLFRSASDSCSDNLLTSFHATSQQAAISGSDRPVLN